MAEKQVMGLSCFSASRKKFGKVPKINFDLDSISFFNVNRKNDKSQDFSIINEIPT